MKTQWQIYKELELLPDSVLEPQDNQANFAGRLSQVWQRKVASFVRSLVFHTSVSTLSHDQSIEYLERCWELDCSEPDTTPNFWHKLWTFLNQPLPIG